MKKALISVYDKTGIVEFARELENLGYGIISTGGTYKKLIDAGLKVEEVTEVTNFPECLDGRVKTLNPYIHCGILYRRDLEEDREFIKKMDISDIDIIVNNLYPFEEYVNDPSKTHDEIIEKIDIGGPSMIRAAAKNYKFVTVIMDPSDFDLVLKELKENKETSLKTREYLAGKVFNYTAYYDSLIADYFNRKQGIEFPEYYTKGYKKISSLRYGENPHQNAAFYKESKVEEGSLVSAKQLHGKELSFNNINDANGALETLKMFTEKPTIVAVKHTNPCGVASADTLAEAFRKARDCDDQSIFGGIIASNREIDAETAEEMRDIFLEVIMAPSYTDEAFKILTDKKKNRRILTIDNITNNEYGSKDMKKVLSGMILQDRDTEFFEDFECVTDRKPTEKEIEDLKFGWKVVKNCKSNATLLAKDSATVGIGLGSVNRFFTVERSVKMAGDKAKGAVLASDAFFPFTDSVELLAKQGVTAIIQPGGSVADEDVIKCCNEHNIAMIFTHMRHFRH
ncbi:bifunctional phosphoribosylaminoimidazolecarboxamide formyltransferase/IMP cyclohydrolase [Fenollaria sporofastidiosus]